MAEQQRSREVELSYFHALSGRQRTFPFCCWISLFWNPIIFLHELAIPPLKIVHVRYIKILTWLRGFLVVFLYLIFDLVFFVFKSLLGIVRQRNCKKFTIDQYWYIEILTWLRITSNNTFLFFFLILPSRGAKLSFLIYRIFFILSPKASNSC